MSNENEKKIYKNKIKKLKIHNKSYYLNSNPTISDAEYDLLKNQI